MLLPVTIDSFRHEVLESDKPVLVDFWAEWCGPCKPLAVMLDEYQELRTDVKFVKANTDDVYPIAAMYNIRSVPTLMLFNGAEHVVTHVGSITKPQLEALLKAWL